LISNAAPNPAVILTADHNDKFLSYYKATLT